MADTNTSGNVPSDNTSNNTSDNVNETEICRICHNELSPEAMAYFKENNYLITSGICEGYLCEDHWCDCMPRSTPWSWVRQCILCARSICKSCKCEDICGHICFECSYERNRRRY